MKRRSNERSKAKSLRPLRLGRGLERSDSLGRPVGEEGLSDDPFLWNGSPVAAVIALATIVAHHKKLARRNRDLFRQIADIGARRQVREAVRLALAVHVGVVVDHPEPVAGQGHDPLDEVGGGLGLGAHRARLVARPWDAALLTVALRTLRRVEHDDVAATRIAEVPRDAVHEDTLSDLEGGLHRAARDPERLDHPRLDGEGEPEGDDDDQYELESRVQRALPFVLLGGGRSLRGRAHGSFEPALSAPASSDPSSVSADPSPASGSSPDASASPSTAGSSAAGPSASRS